MLPWSPPAATYFVLNENAPDPLPLREPETPISPEMPHRIRRHILVATDNGPGLVAVGTTLEASKVI